MVIAFELPPGFYAIDVPLGEPSSGHTTAFKAKSRAVSLAGEVCEICGETRDHEVLACPQLKRAYFENQSGMSRCRLLKDLPTQEDPPHV